MPIPTLVSQVLFLIVLATAGLAIHRITKIGLTLSCVITGFAGGLALPWLNFDTGIRAINVQDLVFYLVLPTLVFDASWHMKPALLKRWLRPVFLLATFGVLTSCLLIALGIYFGIGHPAGFPFIAALLTGAILSSTDPSSVISSLKQLKAPDDLTTMMEGESLLNDSTAIILFSVLLAVALGNSEHTNTNYLTLFASTFIGGILFGCIAGLFAAIICLFIGDRSAAVIVLFSLAFASFYIAEQIFHISGIMAIMAASITSKLLLDEHHDKLLCDVKPTWEWLSLLFTMIVFVLTGLLANIEMFTGQWLAILIAIAVSIAARFVAVYIVSATTRNSTRPIPAAWQLILGWGGLRGVIAIVLVLSLPSSLPYWWTIQSMVFGVVFFSLVVQGLTINALIRKKVMPTDKQKNH